MENGKVFKFFIVFLLLLVSLKLSAQDGSAVIVFGEGEGFTLVRDGESQYYDVTYDDILGMLLFQGDTILTEENTFLEIQVTSNSSLIKIAENTTFSFERIGTKGGGILRVAYGRIRAKINKLSDDDDFEVMGSGTTAGVRGTDFGYDLTYGENLSETRSNEAITSVYCFEGAVKVQQKNKETNEIKEVLVEADQMVVTSSVKEDEPLVVYQINDEIDQFWNENKFVYEMIQVDDAKVVDQEKQEEDNFYTEKIFGEKRRLKYTGGGLTFAGTVLVGSGFAVYNLVEDESIGIGMITVGAASFVAGLILLGNSTTLPDPPEGWIPPSGE